MFPRLAMVIELSKVQVGLKLNAWFQNQTSAQRKFDKISTTLLLIFWNRKSESYWSNILSWFAKYCRSHLSFSCNLIDFFNQALKFDWLCFSKVVSWLEKRCNLEHKMVRFVNKSHQREPYRIQDYVWLKNRCNKTENQIRVTPANTKIVDLFH